MKSVTSLVAGAALVAAASSAMAGEPVALDNASLDQVTAGVGFAYATGTSGTLGDVFSDTYTVVSTYTDDTVYAGAYSESAGAAASLLFGASSYSEITATAYLD